MSRLKFLNILLAVAVFPVLGLLARDYLVLMYPPETKPKAAPEQTLGPNEPAFEEYSAIVEKGVFPGTAKKLTKIDLLEASVASAQGLSDLKLLGTYSGRRSFAVFEKAGGGQEVFKAGDTVFGSGVLTEIGRDKAVISTGASEVTFTVFEEAIPPGLTMMGRESAEKRESASRTYTKQLSESSWVLDQKAVENAVSDMGRVLSDARLTPNASNGAVQGFILTEIKPKGVFDAIGLKNGDVLTSINGYRIDSPEKAVQVLAALKGQEAIDLDIIRQGKPKSFHYSIR